MKRRFSLLVVGLGTVGTIGCETSHDVQPSEVVSTTAQAIYNGTIDTANQFPAVVAIAERDGTEGFCTGTLVTPRWVLTAAHCFLGGGPGGGDLLRPLDGDFDVLFGVDPQNPVFTATHRFENVNGSGSGPILTRIDHPVDTIYDMEIAADIALIRLDELVPPFVAAPYHPAFAASDCGDSFTGTIVGYSGEVITCTPPIQPLRDFTSSAGWSFTATDNGGLYENDWPFGVCSTYYGPGKGDSGGPLIRVDNGALCGVASANLPVVFKAYYSAINVSGLGGLFEGNADWIRDRIVDQFGRFEGECDPPTPLNDPDGDGIASPCDSCPTIWNREQLDMNDDLDGDGHGDACDFCPGQRVIDQTPNCNYETELAYAYPGQTAPPILRRQDFSTDTSFENARLHLRDAFRPDACDPNPCPNQGFLYEPNDVHEQLPAAETANFPDPTLNCPPGLPCKWQVYNTISLLAHSTPAFKDLLPDGAIGAFGNTGLRWCACKDEHDTTILSGRVACRFDPMQGCRVEAMDYNDMSSNWLPISTQASGGWNAGPGKDTGREFNLLYPKQIQIAPFTDTATTIWDFLDLGSMHVKTEPTSIRVHGMLWAHVASLPASIAQQLQYQEFSNTYQAGNASAELVHTGPTPQAVGTDIASICSDCPEGITDIFVASDYPYGFRVTPLGLDPVFRVAPEIRPIYAGIADGTLRMLVAEEPLGRLAQATLPGQVILRGVVVDAVGAPDVVVGSIALDQPLSVVPRTAPIILTTSTAGPVLNHREAMIFSGSERHIFVVGGTTNGSANGPPNDSAWMREVRPGGGDGPWVQIPVPIGERPGEILAATYRMDDHSVYLLDKANGKIRLRRWEPFVRRPDGDVIRILAQWPSTWNSYDRFWISPGSEGDLLVTGTRAQGGGPLHSNFVHLHVAKNGQLMVAGIAHRAQKTLTKPALTARGVSRTVPHASGAKLDTFYLTDFGMNPPAHLPTLE